MTELLPQSPGIKPPAAPPLNIDLGGYPVTADMVAIAAGFVGVAARGCRNRFARAKLHDAVRAALDAAEAIRRDERRVSGGRRHA